MFDRCLSPTRLNRFDRHLDELVEGRTSTPSASPVDPALAETARRLHALHDDSAPEPAVLAAIWENVLNGTASTHRPSEASRPLFGPDGHVSGVDRIGTRPRGELVRRWRPGSLMATAAVVVLTLVAGLLAVRLAPSPPRAAAPPARATEAARNPAAVPTTAVSRHPRTALLLVADASGSMSYDPGDGTGARIDTVKEALRQVARAVAFGDSVGVLVFNDRQQWIVPLTTIATDAERVRIDEAIAAIVAEGGTEIYPALSIGFDAIRYSDADVRRVVLLSDGRSRSGTPAQYRVLVADAASDGITLSTVAIDGDADFDLLMYLAEQGNGRYHLAEEAGDLPDMALRAARPEGTPAS